MAKVLDSDILVSEFEFQSCYYDHFQTNTLEKDMNPLYLSSNQINSTTAILL